MGLVILRHGQNGDQGDGTGLADPAAGTLVHGGQVGVHIAGITTAAGHLFFGRRDLTQCLGIVGDIRQDDQHMHILFKGQILCGGQRHTGCCNTLHGGVVGQVGEQHCTVNGAGAAELLDEELGLLEGDADGGEHHGEVPGIVPQHLGLTGNLGRQSRMGQAGAGEDRQLLASNQGVQAVNGGNAGLDKLGGVVPGGGIHGQAVNVHIGIGKNIRASVNGVAHAVEYPAQHILGNSQL